MTGEGREYGRRKREGSDEDEETDRIVREIIDEVRREQESEESSEPKELPEQVYNPEQCVREAIEEIQQEEAERLKLEEQTESKEEPQASKEQVEISDEWDVDECVREVIEEVQQEESERLRSQEEREHAEMENEQQLEASYESRKETADKDELEEYEERIREGFEEYGIDPEEVKERWRKKFEEEVQDELGEKSREQTEGKDDETAESERTAESHYYYDDGSGQMYEVQMDSKESSGSETESCNDVQEVQEQPPSEQHETNESKKGSEENELENETPTQETEDVARDKSRIGEGPEQEEPTRIETEEVKQAKEKSTKESAETSSEEHSERTSEIDANPEKNKEISSSTPETDTKRTHEQLEPEGSQETVEDESESREEEIWNNYEIEHGSLEDENHKRYLREVMNQLPEEERERFREYVRNQVQTIEDFEELARKHGLDELLEDEEVMEEVRTYLKLRQALEDNPDSDLEQLAEEMEIDIDLAREWSRGESEPYSLKKLLNLEAFYLWDEVIRSYRELTLPRSRAELEVRLESNSELRTDRFFPLELDDALTWVEIMAMRRRGEIQKRIRNGREVYSRKQIMELSKTYGISAREIIQWLRGEKIAALIRKIGIKELKTQNQDATSLVEIIYRLYFVEGKTQQEVAEILDNKSTQPIRRIFREQGWTPRYSQSQVIPREKIDDESVRLLYFDKGLTLQGAATKLGTSLRVIRQIFLENGWTTRAGSRNHPKPDTFFEPITPQDEDDLERIVYVLYYNQNLSQRQIANTLGYNSIAPIRRIFRKNNWQVRSITGSRAKHRIFTSDEERSAAVKGYGVKTREKIVDLRERLFGTKCKICGVSKENKKTIVIHRKDGALHDESELWRIKYLKSLNPEEWIALCVRCHRGVHWMMNKLDKTWKNVESRLGMKITNMPSKRKRVELPSNDTESSEPYKQIKPTFRGTTDELKKKIFGNSCHYCGNDYGKRRLVLHRKDGTPHHPKLTGLEKYFRTLDPKKWVVLCQKCHVYVHWSMDDLGMTWNDLKKQK